MKNVMIERSLRVFLPLLILPLASGCGLFKVREKNDVEVAKIHKAAVVAFSVLEPASAAVSLSLSKGRTEAVAGGSMITQHSDHIEDMYANMRTELSKNLHWEVLDEAPMITNAGYQTAYDKTMKGWQNKMPPGAGEKQFAVKDVMDFDSGRILGPEGRDALIQALGVDAIVVAHVDVQLSGTTVMGIGSRYPQSRVSFQVYARGQEKPVWFDGGVEGDVSQESVGATGFIDEDLLGRLAAKSAVTAFQKIGSPSQM